MKRTLTPECIGAPVMCPGWSKGHACTRAMRCAAVCACPEVRAGVDTSPVVLRPVHRLLVCECSRPRQGTKRKYEVVTLPVPFDKQTTGKLNESRLTPNPKNSSPLGRCRSRTYWQRVGRVSVGGVSHHAKLSNPRVGAVRGLLKRTCWARAHMCTCVC